MGEALKVLVVPMQHRLVGGQGIASEAGLGRRISGWCEERLDKGHWVYVWADGVYSGQRAEQTKLCALVVIGVNDAW